MCYEVLVQFVLSKGRDSIQVSQSNTLYKIEVNSLVYQIQSILKLFCEAFKMAVIGGL
jgi:hypothetical protein